VFKIFIVRNLNEEEELEKSYYEKMNKLEEKEKNAFYVY